MKNIITKLAGIACVFTFILAFAENADGSCNILWSLGCIAVSLGLGIFIKHYNPKAFGNE